jgi:hypothetical protein
MPGGGSVLRHLAQSSYDRSPPNRYLTAIYNTIDTLTLAHLTFQQSPAQLSDGNPLS